jgi:hypothetical protein
LWISQEKIITFTQKLNVMDKKVQIDNIYQKLWKAKQEIGKVTKGSNNPFFKSKYADLNAILEATEPILLKHELIVLQPVINGFVCTQIIDIATGDKVESVLQLPEINDPQKLIASITYYRRGSLQSLLSLQAVDDDGNTAREGVKETKPSIAMDRFEKALQMVADGKLSKDELTKKMEAFTLNEVQQAALLVL